jgi:hypothetical protein
VWSAPQEVMGGKYDATFMRAVDQLRARKLGARILELPNMATMIEAASLEAQAIPDAGHDPECFRLGAQERS